MSTMGKKRSERPGIMFWFDDWLPLLKLDDAKLATLFRACLLYAQDGTEPDFAGTDLVIFEMLAPKLDRDAERYEARSRSGEYAAYCREERKAGKEPISFELWLERSQRSVSDDNEAHRSIPVDIDLNQLHQHPQPHLHSHSQLQQQRQGDPKGGADMPEVYRPLSEHDFEEHRAAALRKLGL